MTDLALAWKQRTLICTGPATYYLAVAVTGPLPGRRQVCEFIDELQHACQAQLAYDGMRIRAVRGRMILDTSRTAHLSLYVTIANPSGDPRRDSAYVSQALRAAAERSADREVSRTRRAEAFASATYEAQCQLSWRARPARPPLGVRRGGHR